MKLLAAGRDCDVFDAGPGRVLRRARDGRSLESEAHVMRHVREHGYPVPEVFDAAGPDLVLERIDGPELLDWAVKRPWRVRRAVRILGDMHHRLHRVPVPPGLPQFGVPADDDVLVHFDLHPLNILVAASGPVVIDWTNARRGSAAADVAQTWVIMATSENDLPGALRPAVGVLRSWFVKSFLRTQDVAAARAALPAVAASRKADRNVRPAEVVEIDRLVAREGAGR